MVRFCSPPILGGAGGGKVIRSKDDTTMKYAPQFNSFTRYCRGDPLRSPALCLSCVVVSGRHYKSTGGHPQGVPLQNQIDVFGLSRVTLQYRPHRH